MSLAEKQSALTPKEAQERASRLPNWQLSGSSIVRELSFKDFRQAMNFTNRVAQLAEALDHHPDILISYNKVKLELSTHSAGGLTEKDFLLAEQIDRAHG